MAEGEDDSGASLSSLRAYFVADTFPTNVREGAHLLDANVTKDIHERVRGRDDWYAAIKNRALCRIPWLSEAVQAVWPHFPQHRESLFLALLKDRCVQNASKLPETSARNFAPNQVDEAIRGKRIVFERAAVIVYTFNEIVVERINELIQRDGTSSPSVEILKDALIPEHSVTLGAFYFYDMAGVVSIAASAMTGIRQLCTFIASSTGMPFSVVEGLLGYEDGVRILSQSSRDKQVKWCGDYSTLRAIYKALELIPQAEAEIKQYPRDHHIQRLHVGTGNKRVHSEEPVNVARRINRPPYDWGPPIEGEGDWPEDIVAAEGGE